MSLKSQITEDMKSAMKAGEKDRLKIVRLILAAIKQVEVDTREEQSDEAVQALLTTMVKQRRDSIEQFDKGGREDLSTIERAEIDVLMTYFPKQLSPDELAALIDEAIQTTAADSIRDMGKVMAEVKLKAADRAEMRTVGALVKQRLNAL